MSPREMREQYPMDKRPARIVGELQAARMLRAVTSERQLDEVMVDFWLNHFSVFAGKGGSRWYLPDWERTVIRPNALGRFPTPAGERTAPRHALLSRQLAQHAGGLRGASRPQPGAAGRESTRTMLAN